jgi:hypothetical protein
MPLSHNTFSHGVAHFGHFNYFSHSILSIEISLKLI